MVLLFSDKIDTPFVLTLVAMLIESYFAITYVTKDDYNYNDKVRLVIGILCILTIVFALFQWKTLASGVNGQSILLLLSVVGSAIVASYFLAPENKDYKTDWRRKFTEIFYYVITAMAVATALGIKQASSVVTTEAKGATDLLETAEEVVENIGSTALQATKSLGVGAFEATKSLGNGAFEATKNLGSGAFEATKSLGTGAFEATKNLGTGLTKVGSELYKGVRKAGESLADGVTKRA